MNLDPSELFGKVIEKFQICECHYFDPVHSIKLLSTFIPISQNDLRIKTKLGQVDNNIKYNTRTATLTTLTLTETKKEEN